MKRFTRKSVVFAAVAALTLHPVLAQAQVAVGNANKIVSNVRGVLQANTRTLVTQDNVFSNEVVNTGANSAARFIFRDKTMLSVGANSSVTLDYFVFDADSAKSQVALSMSKGVMRFVTGNLSKDRYTIRTPTALIGIRGTILVITVALNGATSISVVEGAVSVTAAGTTTSVGSGFSTSVSPGAVRQPAIATAGAEYGSCPGAGAGRRHGPASKRFRRGWLVRWCHRRRRRSGGIGGIGHRGRGK